MLCAFRVRKYISYILYLIPFKLTGDGPAAPDVALKELGGAGDVELPAPLLPPVVGDELVHPLPAHRRDLSETDRGGQSIIQARGKDHTQVYNQLSSRQVPIQQIII